MNPIAYTHRYSLSCWKQLLICLLLTVCGGKAYADETFDTRILYKDGSTPQDINESVDTLYMLPDERRFLTIAHLALDSYRGYFRWYQYANPQTKTEVFRKAAFIKNETGNWKSWNQEYTNGYVFKGKQTSKTDDFGFGIDYTLENSTSSGTEDYVDCVVCDISDLLDWELAPGNSSQIQTEPTLTLRKIFYIKPASAIAERIEGAKANGKPLEYVDIHVPANLETTFRTVLHPEDYYMNDAMTPKRVTAIKWEAGWGNNNQVQVRALAPYLQAIRDKNGANKLKYTPGFFKTNTPKDAPTGGFYTLNVYGTTEDVPEGDLTTWSPNNGWTLLYEYRIFPEINSKILTAQDIKNGEATGDLLYRNQKYMDQNFHLLGAVQFDYDLDKATRKNNAYPYPLSRSESTYAFSYPDKVIANWETMELGKIKAHNLMTVSRNEYGMFKTLNVPEISSNKILGQDVANWWFANEDLKDMLLIGRTAEQSLLDHGTWGDVNGYFLYLDAADDAGSIITIPLPYELCSDTRIIVTAWVCNMKGTEGEVDADISFTFKGVHHGDEDDGAFMKGRHTHTLYKYYTGSIPWANNSYYKKEETYPGKRIARWQQVYFSFDFTKEWEYKEYELEILNNCSSSSGADYAIDDIRIYRTKPSLEVTQDNMCSETGEAIRNLTVRTEFGTLLRNLGLSENQVVHDTEKENEFTYGFTENQKNVYYFFMRPQLDGTYDTTKVDYTYIKLNYTGLTETELKEKLKIDLTDPTYKHNLQYGRTIISTNRDDYKNEKGEYLTADKAKAKSMEYYNTLIEQHPTAKNYSLPLYAWMQEEENGKTYVYIDQLEIKVKNENGEENTQGLYPNTTYGVQIQGGEGDFPDPNDPCSLVSTFIFQPATTILINGIADLGQSKPCVNEQIMLEAKLSGVNIDNNEPVDNIDNVEFDWFIGSKQEFEKTIEDNTEGLGDKPSIKKILDVLRSVHNDRHLDEEGLKALEPTGPSSKLFTKEMQAFLINLIDNGKLMLLKKAFPYTLKYGTNQFVAIPIEPQTGGESDQRTCWEPTEITIETEDTAPQMKLGLSDVTYPEEDFIVPLRIGKAQIQACSGTSGQDLTVPIRWAKATREGSTFSPKDKDDETIYLVSTTEKEGGYASMEPVATLQSITLSEEDLSSEDGKTSDASLKIRFDEGIAERFKEGYTYTLEIPFEETEGTGTPTNCNASVFLPLKIVPEFLSWIATEGNNWNNDANWERSRLTDDLYYLEGQDNNRNAFAPMAFTKVTILQRNTNEDFPYLGKLNKTDKGVLNLQPLTDIGKSTPLMEYDMMVYDPEHDQKTGYEAGAFYGNRCKEICFQPTTGLMNQQYLTYEKARVEFELEKDKWYILSSPLQDTYSGDMYTRKLDSRQETPTFEEISYNKTNNYNDRFAPAVYQRGWDKASIMYFEENSFHSESKDMFVASTWSNVYNDAFVPYASGNGFSVRVENATSGNKNPMFRIPKKDTTYKYYAENNGNEHTSGQKEVDKNDMGKLLLEEGNSSISITVTKEKDETANGNTIFLTGNPFMTDLNMQKFIETNKNVLAENTYWFAADGSMQAAIYSAENGWITTKAGMSTGTIAPLQGFFVKSNQSTSLDLTFTTTMMSPRDRRNTIQPLTTKADAINGKPLVIKAERQGATCNTLLLYNPKANTTYDSKEDVEILIDSNLKGQPSVYTIAGDMAVQINQTPTLRNIPLGIYSDNEEEVTLTFEGLEHFGDSLYLYDALTKESIKLDALTTRVTVPGSTHGRYFLNGTDEMTADGDIAIYSPTPGRLVVAAPAPEALDRVRVYTPAGQLVQTFSGLNTSAHTFDLPQGIYLIEAVSERAAKKAKMHIR
ncbi:hypothetical protein [Parabacteroides sp.]